MRVVLQRSKKASVTVDGEIVGQIPFGLTLLVGITHEDTEKMQLTLRKNCKLTYFEDESGKMNHSVLDVEGQVLSISQFTLYGDCRKEDVQTLWMLRNLIMQSVYTISLMKKFVNKDYMWKQGSSSNDGCFFNQ